MNRAKLALAGTYGWAVAAAIAPGVVPGSDLAKKIGLGLLAVHALELPFYMKDIRRTGEPVGGHIVQVMLFGVVHHMAIKKQLAAQA